MRHVRLHVLCLLVLAGCGKNELSGDLTFPEQDDLSEEAPTSMGEWLSLDRSPDASQLTMSYYDVDKSGLGYAVGTPLGDGTVRWAHEKVDGYPESNGLDTGQRGKYSSQKTAPDGTVWVSYWDEQAGSLRVAHRTSPHVWETAEVDPGGGLWTSLAIGADGRPFVAHCDQLGDVRLSRFDGSAWSTTTVYTSTAGVAPAGVAQTAALVAGGKEYVAFSDLGSGALHLMVDGQDDVVVGSGGGEWPSVEVDGDTVWVAFQDSTNEDLVVAKKQGGGDWDRTVVDDGKLEGADSAMYLDNGSPVVVYFDGWDNDAKVAKLSGDQWSTERLAGDTAAVGFHNRVVQAGGHWWAGSYDVSNDTLALVRL